MTSRWLQAQLTLVINLLTLKTVDISSVKLEIIILDNSRDIQPF